MVIDKPEQERPQKARKNLLDSGSLKGQQARHKLGIHPGQVCLGDLPPERDVFWRMSGESRGEGLGQRIQLNLWKAAPLSTRKNRGIRTGVLMPRLPGEKEGALRYKVQGLEFCSVPPSSRK